MDASSGFLAAWADVADELEWATPWTSVYERESRRWFAGGRINLAVNCVDRHVRNGLGGSPAVCWEGEPGDRRVVSYNKLREEIGQLSGALRDLGVGVGDLVALHLGPLLEAVTAALACARIGAVHVVLPAQESTPALAEHLAELRPSVLFTQDGGWRGGTIIPMKARVDDAVGSVGEVPYTVVVQRTGTPVSWHSRDRWLHDLMAAARGGDPGDGPLPTALTPEHAACVSVATDRGGRAGYVRHGTAGLLASAVAVHRYGLSAGGVLWCATDPERIETLVHGIYGPLACGDTVVVYEGLPDMPTRERPWELIRRYEVRTLVATPSVLRLRGLSRSRSRPHPTALRRLVSLGTPSGDDVAWVRNVAGVTDDSSRLSVDIAWAATETCGVALISDPVDPARFPDAGFVVVDPGGHETEADEGELVITRPWAGLAAAGGRGDGASRMDGVGYRTGQLARRGADGRLVPVGPADGVRADVTAPYASPGTA